jgi:4-carboxymuconolactone decarboxylase
MQAFIERQTRMSRLPPVSEKASPAVAEVFGEIAATRGFVSNALSSVGHAPEGLRHLARLGAYAKYQTDLPERLRELCILCAARGVAYAWTHHMSLAMQAGIAQEAVDAIGAGRAPATLPPSEQAIARYIQELFSAQSVSDGAFAELARHFTPRQITDISLTATYYRALGTMVMAFGVEMESPAVLKIEKDWQKSKAKL